jgi:hypothetical protein
MLLACTVILLFMLPSRDGMAVVCHHAQLLLVEIKSP